MQTPQPPCTPRFSRPKVRTTTTSAALFVLGACLAATPLLFTVPRAGAQSGAASVEVSAQAGEGDFRLFYDKLTDGSWLQTEQYGYVFQPEVAAQDREWRPYTDGYWAQTDQGWTWVSNEPFGWACYHYGRWANLVDTGWVWVPGAEWAPAYVSWRMSKDKKTVGWAPLPPEARVSKSAGVERWSDSAYDVGPESYNFIETSSIGENTYRGRLLPSERVTTVFTESENVTSVTYRTVSNRSVVYTGGPDVAVIREVSGRPVRELRLDYQERPVEFFVSGNNRGFNNVDGNRFVVAAAAPDVIRSTTIQIREPRNVTRRLTTVEVDRGYRGLRDPQEVERIRTSVRTQTPLPPEVERQTATLRERGGNRRDVATPAGGNNVGTVPPPPPAAPNASGNAGTPDASPAATATGRATPAASPSAAPTAARPGTSPAPERRPDAGQAPPEAAASPAPSARPGRSPRPGADARETPAPARPEATPRANREATTPPAATPRPSAPGQERPERPERRGEVNRPRDKATPAERETARPDATPANRTPETPRNKPAAPDAAEPRGDKPPRTEATPAARQGGGTGNRAEEGGGNTPATRREAPPASPGRAEEAKPKTPAGGDGNRPETPARRLETGAERPERGGGGGAGGGATRGAEERAATPAGAGGAAKEEKKAGGEAAGDEKDKAKPTPKTLRRSLNLPNPYSLGKRRGGASEGMHRPFRVTC